MNPDLYIIVWSVLSGILAASVVFFFLTIEKKRSATSKAAVSWLKTILVVFFIASAAAAVYHFLLPSQTITTNGVLFPSTGLNPFAPNSLPINGLITFSLIIPIVLLAIAASRNRAVRRLIEKDLEDEKIAARNVSEDLFVEVQKLAEAKAKEETILLSIGDGLIATDEKGKILLINKKAEELLDNKNEEVIGKAFTEVIQIEDEKGTPIGLEKRPMSMALSSGASTAITTSGPTYYYLRPDKTRFPAAITVTPVVLHDKVIGTIEIFRDITKEKDIDRAKTEFVSLASHQLRTPLTAISWYTEMILNGNVGRVSSKQRKYLEEVYDGNRRMIELVNTLLDVSRIEMGTFKVKSEPTNIVLLAESVLNEQRARILKKKIEIVQNFSPDIPTLSIDPKLLHIVFQNFLNNSLEYTPEGGKIEFSISLDDKKSILIKISDTGYGIPKSQQSQIFRKLFRADNVRDKDPNGTGLGLYIVKSIVENSGGKIWFESKENKGSTFYVSLPLV